LKSNLHDLIDGKFPLEDLVITKSLRADYKDPEKIAHKVLAERMGERDPGNKPMVNDRIPFVYIQPPNQKKNEKILQGDRIEHPTYIQKQGLKPDYEFYITNQIMKPILQLYALTLENLDGYRKGAQYFKDTEKKLLVEKDGDLKKVKDRLDDLREGEVQKLLFDPLLVKLQNKKKGNREITEFFSFANAKNT
jgi:DNA polymerase elongation subunit (family B)